MQLQPGESITWSGKGSDRLLVRSDYFFVLSGAVLGVVALAAFIAALIAVFSGDAEAALLGFVVSTFAAVASIRLMFGRLARRLRRAKDTSYAITNQRVVRTVGSEETSVPLADKPKTSLVNHFERRGTITVGAIKLENIDDAAVVYELLSAELAKAAGASTSTSHP